MSETKITKRAVDGGYAVRRGAGQWRGFYVCAGEYHVPTDELTYMTTSLEDAASYAAAFSSLRSKTLRGLFADDA